MTAVRKHLAPSLVEAYEVWHGTEDLSVFKDLLNRLPAHWENMATEITALYSISGEAEPIENLIKSNKI